MENVHDSNRRPAGTEAETASLLSREQAARLARNIPVLTLPFLMLQRSLPSVLQAGSGPAPSDRFASSQRLCIRLSSCYILKCMAGIVLRSCPTRTRTMMVLHSLTFYEVFIGMTPSHSQRVSQSSARTSTHPFAPNSARRWLPWCHELLITPRSSCFAK